MENTDMDYKELIKKLREKDGCRCECLQAADAIETLLAERDAAVEMLKGTCSACKYQERYLDDYPCCHCYRTGGMSDNWEWSGPQKGGAGDE